MHGVQKVCKHDKNFDSLSQRFSRHLQQTEIASKNALSSSSITMLSDADNGFTSTEDRSLVSDATVFVVSASILKSIFH